MSDNAFEIVNDPKVTTAAQLFQQEYLNSCANGRCGSPQLAGASGSDCSSGQCGTGGGGSDCSGGSCPSAAMGGAGRLGIGSIAGTLLAGLRGIGRGLGSLFS
jgi:hypothetical protein